MLCRACCVLSAVLCLTVLSLPAVAGEDAKATVSGSGLVVLRPSPDRLRLVMTVKAHGTTTQSALENLKTQRDAIVAKLIKLNVDPESVYFDTPRVGNLADEPSFATSAVPVAVVGPSWTPAPTTYPPSATPAYAPPGVMAPVAPSTPVKKPPTVYVAKTVLRVEWPLPKDGRDQLAVAVADIKEKVKAANLEENEAKKNLSAEEEEIVEEAAMGLFSPHRATPVMLPSSVGNAFVYVAKPTDVQRKKALAEAFKRAKKNAADLAEAAGMTLGSITSISNNNSYHYTHVTHGTDGSFYPLEKLSDEEVVANDPDELKFAFGVTVYFRMLAK